MRIVVRGWGRDQGETEIMSVPLKDAVDPPGAGEYYQLDQAYLEIENPSLRKWATAKFAANTNELRMGGRYFLRVELSREEISKLFFATHNGDIVRTFRQLLEDEERQEEEEEQRQEAALQLARIERRRRLAAQVEKQELLKQTVEKLASLKQRQE